MFNSIKDKGRFDMGKNVREGSCFPQGATTAEGGVNFALFSRHAEGIDLLLFDQPQDAEPSDVIQMNNKTCFVWHCFVEGVAPGQLYAYRVRGPLPAPKRLLFERLRIFCSGPPGSCFSRYEADS